MFSENLENQNILAESGVRDLGVEKVSGKIKTKQKKNTGWTAKAEKGKQHGISVLMFLSFY